MTRHVPFAVLTGAIALLLAAGPASAAISVPADFDFGNESDAGKDTPSNLTAPGTNAITGFTVSNQASSSWSLAADSLNFNTATTTFASGMAAGQFELGNLNTLPGFEITLRGTMPGTASQGNNFARTEISIFGSAAPTINSTTNDVGIPNAIAIRAFVGSSTALQIGTKSSDGTFTQLGTASVTGFRTNDFRDYTFTGLFVGNDLQLTATMESGANSATVSHTITNVDRSAWGNWITLGTRNSSNGGGTMQFDTMTVSIIPEPASLALMGLGGLLMLSRGRRA